MLNAKTLVVVFFLYDFGHSFPGARYLDWVTQDSITNLMNPQYLPAGEPRWTCRVWCKVVLEKAAWKDYIKLPASLRE